MDRVSPVVLVIAALLTASGLLAIYLFVWLRAARQALEASHIAQQHVRHTDILLEHTPRRFQRFVARFVPDLDTLGFKDLLTGARLTLSEGRADTHYHVAVSPDKTTTAEMTHVRVGWHLGSLWPAQLPLSKWMGPVTLTLTLESFSTDHTTLITTTDANIAAMDPLPSWRVVILTPDTAFEELWNRHQAEQKKLVEEERKRWVLFNAPEAYREKERVQREQVARKDARELQELFGEDRDAESDWDGRQD